MPKDYTPRGFAIYEDFLDNREQHVVVQKSSAAEEPSVWVQCKYKGLDSPPHLNVEDAKRVIAALQEFVNENDHFPSI